MSIGKLLPGLLFASALLTGCARVAMKPRNEAQTPVFFPGAYFDIGLEGGAEWHKAPPVPPETGPQGPFRLRYDIPEIEGGRGFIVNWNDWADSYLIPVYWMFLLTGEQYEGENLKTGKPHLALEGGLENFQYGEEKWTIGTGLALSGKYLFTPRTFATLRAKAEFPQTDEYFIASLSGQVGRQLTERLSLSVFATPSRIFLPEGYQVTERGANYRDGDMRTVAGARALFYFRSRHIFGSEAGMLFRNGEASDPHRLYASLTYRYVFDLKEKPR
jgi:hypothetical protein